LSIEADAGSARRIRQNNELGPEQENIHFDLSADMICGKAIIQWMLVVSRPSQFFTDRGLRL
jgi:hypothetical protein